MLRKNKELKAIATATTISFLLWFGYYLLTAPIGITTIEQPNPYLQPLQKNISSQPAPAFSISSMWQTYYLTAQAEYEINARVLSRKRYFLGWQSSFSPVDLALGWGMVANENIDEHINWWQSGRWYYWRTNNRAYNAKNVGNNSANVHMIPANDNIRKALLRVRKNDIVKIQGYLVNVNSVNGGGTYTWNTSTSRTDKGDGACEIMYVQRLIMNEQLYE